MTAEAHVCPRCHGERMVFDKEAEGMRKCPTCRGDGVVWREGPQEASNGDWPEGILDLQES